MTENLKVYGFDDIMSNCLKSLWSLENSPDNPFPTLYRSLKYYVVQQAMQKTRGQINDQVTGLKRNQVIEEAEYYITSVAGMYNAYGTRNILELLDAPHVSSLMRCISAFC